jgi:Co/Zn/Cd efflux system component
LLSVRHCLQHPQVWNILFESFKRLKRERSHQTVQTILSAFVGGLLMNIIGFCVMHDGSHYAISKRVWVNRVLHTLWK